MKRKPKTEKPVPLDPKAEVFEVGDFIEVLRRPLWTGCRGVVARVDGGMVRCIIGTGGPQFSADIPASQLKKLLGDYPLETRKQTVIK